MKFWRYFNLADSSVQHMKLCTFIILAEFKFSNMDPIRQIVKLKSSPKFQRIWYEYYSSYMVVLGASRTVRVADSDKEDS